MPSRNHESGISLVSILVIVSITGVMAAAMMQQITHAEKRKANLVLAGELFQVRAHFKHRINCEKLPDNLQCRLKGLAQSNCQNNRVPLYDQSNNVLLQSGTNGSQIGAGVRARACCSKGNLMVEVKQTGSTGSARQDPLNPNITYDWVNIYEHEPSPCDFYLKNSNELLLPPGIKVVKGPIIPEGLLLSLLTETSIRCPSYSGELGGTPEIYAELGNTVSCPSGYKVMSGGVSCEAASILPLYPSFYHLHPGGYQKLSGPNAAGTAWRGSCCSAANSLPLAWADKISVVCARQ